MIQLSKKKKKNQSKPNFCKYLIAKLQQLDQQYNLRPNDFSLTLMLV